jgi:hypothetical protein
MDGSIPAEPLSVIVTALYCPDPKVQVPSSAALTPLVLED